MYLHNTNSNPLPFIPMCNWAALVYYGVWCSISVYMYSIIALSCPDHVTGPPPPPPSPSISHPAESAQAPSPKLQTAYSLTLPWPGTEKRETAGVSVTSQSMGGLLGLKGGTGSLQLMARVCSRLNPLYLHGFLLCVWAACSLQPVQKQEQYQNEKRS